MKWYCLVLYFISSILSNFHEVEGIEMQYIGNETQSVMARKYCKVSQNESYFLPILDEDYGGTDMLNVIGTHEEYKCHWVFECKLIDIIKNTWKGSVQKCKFAKDYVFPRDLGKQSKAWCQRRHKLTSDQHPCGTKGRNMTQPIKIKNKTIPVGKSAPQFRAVSATTTKSGTTSVPTNSICLDLSNCSIASATPSGLDTTNKTENPSDEGNKKRRKPTRSPIGSTTEDDDSTPQSDGPGPWDYAQ